MALLSRTLPHISHTYHAEHKNILETSYFRSGEFCRVFSGALCGVLCRTLCGAFGDALGGLLLPVDLSLSSVFGLAPTATLGLARTDGGRMGSGRTVLRPPTGVERLAELRPAQAVQRQRRRQIDVK